MPDAQQYEAFVRLVEQHRRQVFGYIYALVRSFQDSEDIYQDTCMVLWNKFDQFQPDTNFVSWACQVAQFEVRNFVKRRSRSHLHFTPDLQDQLAEVQAAVTSDDSDRYYAALDTCMEKLPVNDRQLIQACYGDARPFKKVAEEMQRSPHSIYDALSRIRHSLLDCIRRTLAREGHS